MAFDCHIRTRGGVFSEEKKSGYSGSMDEHLGGSYFLPYSVGFSICGSWWGKKVPNVTDVCGVYL